MASINQYQIRSAIEKAEESISASELASNKFYAELFDPIRVNTSVRKFLYGIERSKKQSTIQSAELILGYTRSEFINHIEKQFTGDMCWEKRGEWHIDHITPVSRLIKDGNVNIRKINCLSNLIPIPARDNLIKGDRLTSLF